MNYVNKNYSLEERASAQVAINLCQEAGFMEVALCLEQPTYGYFIGSHFVKDPEKISAREKEERDNRCHPFVKSCLHTAREKVRRWDEAIDEQCRRLTQGIPLCLRQGIHPWMNLIALEYLSYCRRQEAVFGVSRYFLMNVFTAGDWKADARLDEEKLAQRLLEDERLTVLQRFRIACVNCLHVQIPQLWERLTQEEKRFASGDGSLGTNKKETHSLVLLWSLHVNDIPMDVASEFHPWFQVVNQANDFGNCSALKLCWKRLKKSIRRRIVLKIALKFLRKWQRVRIEGVKMELVSNESSGYVSVGFTQRFNLPSYYIELIRFFLSQMEEEHQLRFFKLSFQFNNCDQRLFSKSLLECFLDFPYQDDFLPTINRLWGIIPKYNYGQCLLALTRKYSGNDEKKICDYDYGSLIRTLWNNTPVEYKLYMFCDKGPSFSMTNEGNELLSVLLKISSFQEKDEALFKHIFRDQPQEERRAMLLSEVGRNMCLLLVQKEKWSFINGLIEECLLEEEIPDFKKRFIQSDCGVELCIRIIGEGRVKPVEDLLCWSFESDVEKAQRKDALISDSRCLHACGSLLVKGEFAKVERLINFCLSSDEEKERAKVQFVQYTCISLLNAYASQCRIGDPWSEDPVWDKMNTIIAWILGTDEQIRDLKNNIFSSAGFDVHYDIVFTKSLWGEVGCFYKWFGLSTEEINELKRDTLFDSRVIEDIHKYLLGYNLSYASLRSLLWCINDEEKVIDLKKKVEEAHFTGALNGRMQMNNVWLSQRLDHLISELLDGFRKTEDWDKTNREGVFLNDKGKKRSFTVMENESTSPRKGSK